MTRDANTAFARAFVDEWARHGLTDAVLAPGSRSAPLALALAADERLRLHVFLDERSAAFFALGLARATGLPAPLLCTSGTAAANFLPAVVEAHHSRVPMIVCTADRPPELRDTGAGQTIDQTKLYGGAVRWFHEANVPDDRPGVGAEWRALASRAVAAATGAPAGPVHLNLPFREPLVPTGDELVDAPGRSDDRPWTATAPGRARPVGRDARRARPPRGRPAPRPDRRGLGRGRAAGHAAALRRGCGLAGARRPAVELPGGRHHLHLRPVAARSRVPRRAPPRPRVPHRRPAHQQGRDAVARRHGRPGARRPRRRVARPAARGERAHGGRPRAAARRAGRRHRRDGRPGLGRRVDRRRRAGARGDRHAGGGVGRAVRGTHRARCRRGRAPPTPRWSSRRACRCATSRASPRRATASPSTRTGASTGSTGSPPPCSASPPRTTGRRWRSPATSASSTTATVCSARRAAGSTRRSWWSTTTAAGSSRSSRRPSCPSTSRRCSVRRRASTSPTCARCTTSR